ncbi:MAG: hypothetical protein ABI844_01515 [Saprospiraceae bacterium]
MSTTKKPSSKKVAKPVSKKAKQPKPKLTTTQLKKESSQTIKIEYLNKASKFSEARKKDTIHPRKILPKVKSGAQIKDKLPTAAMAFEEQVSIAQMADVRGAKPKAFTDTITFLKNVQLDDVATADTASHVCEPSAAVNGKVIFYTGNWFAAISIDGGSTFKYINPYNSFPDPPGMGFCCDQVVHYIKSIDTFIWLLQYTADTTGKNIQRVAYATTAKVKTGTWKYYDFTPANLGLAAGIWLDFPDLSTSSNYLYMSTNSFDGGGNFKSSVLVRIKFSSFTTGVRSARKYVSTSFSSFRVAQNCGTTAYFVAHKSTSALRVFSWKESTTTPTFKDVSVASWNPNGYTSTTPDGKDWLKRADGRHIGATLASGELWFSWGSAKGGANNRPQAFVQIARIKISTMTLAQNINLWDTKAAIFYAGLSTNSNNEVGASFAMGGGTIFPRHMVGILTNTGRQVVTFSGNRGPADNKWGDYLTVRRNYPNQKLFCATGYVLKSGAGLSDATPNVTIFGRSSDVV